MWVFLVIGALVAAVLGRKWILYYDAAYGLGYALEYRRHFAKGARFILKRRRGDAYGYEQIGESILIPDFNVSSYGEIGGWIYDITEDQEVADYLVDQLGRNVPLFFLSLKGVKR